MDTMHRLVCCNYFSLFIGGSEFLRISDVLWGLLSGLSGVMGLLLIFKGLSCGIASIVSPSSAITGAVFPVLFGLLIGERPSTLTWFGIICSLPAIVLLSWEKKDGENNENLSARSIKYGLGSGLFFGGFFILLSQTSESSGLWALVFAKLGNVIVVLLILFLRRNKFRLEKGTKKITIF